MSFAPSAPRNTEALELASWLHQPEWSQLVSTAGASGAIIHQGSLAGNPLDPTDERVPFTSSDVPLVLGGALSSHPFPTIVQTARGSYSLNESSDPGLRENIALHPDVIETYARRMLAAANTPRELLASSAVNVEPLALLRIVRASADASRALVLADVRRRLDRAKAPHASRSPRDIVMELGDSYGLNQLSIARAVGVTPTAVRKWRRGEHARPEFRDRLALLMALLRLLQDAGQDQPAAWLEVPVSGDSSLTPLDLFSAGRSDLIMLLAAATEDPQTVLDSFDVDWREKYAPDREYMVIVAADGERAIVPRERWTRDTRRI